MLSDFILIFLAGTSEFWQGDLAHRIMVMHWDAYWLKSTYDGPREDISAQSLTDGLKEIIRYVATMYVDYSLYSSRSPSLTYFLAL